VRLATTLRPLFLRPPPRIQAGWKKDAFPWDGRPPRDSHPAAAGQPVGAPLLTPEKVRLGIWASSPIATSCS
jgi:hypothetical protein